MVLEFDELVLEKDTVFNESIRVKKNISCKTIRVNLKVNGDIDAENIDAGNINAWNINAGNIDAGDIDAGNIDAWNIDAGNINALFIVCEKRVKRTKRNKTFVKSLITNRSKLTQKEVDVK